ncbi:MAG: hypothetical protein R6U68_02195 [Desulfobacteraceae bacterium]
MPKKKLEQARLNHETVCDKKAEIGQVYHPYNLDTGQKQNSEAVSDLLADCFDKIRHVHDGRPCGAVHMGARKMIFHNQKGYGIFGIFKMLNTWLYEKKSRVLRFKKECNGDQK